MSGRMDKNDVGAPEKQFVLFIISSFDAAVTSFNFSDWSAGMASQSVIPWQCEKSSLQLVSWANKKSLTDADVIVLSGKFN